MCRFVLFILCCFIAISVATNDQTDSKSIQAIYDFLEECSTNFTLGEQKDVVVVLGNTGSGKSTVTLLLIGAKLIAVETIEGSGDFVIKDEKNIISPPEQSTQSQTLIPNLNIDKEANTSYYDCAGFEDSRGVAHDLSVTYLIQKLLKFAHSVKFMFVIPYSSVKVGGDRHDFKKLARHATALIKNIDKYHDAIAMIVTKADTKIANGQIVPDEKIIESVGVFLNQTKMSLNGENANAKINMEKFIDILLQKQNNAFNRIQIVRSPTEAGSFNEMTFPKQEKHAIKMMLENTLKYTITENDDFGFSISAESMLIVYELFIELERILINDVISIGDEIHDFYANELTQIDDKPQLIINLMSGYEYLSHVTANDLDLFKQQLINATAVLQINISTINLNNFDRHIEYVHFLTSVSDVQLSTNFQISDGLKNVTEYMIAATEQYKLELLIEVKANLAQDVLNINNEIKSFYLEKEMKTFDINNLNEFMVSQFNVLSMVTSKEPAEFYNQLVTAVNSLHIKISTDTLKLLFKHIEMVQFLETLNNFTHIQIENGLSTSMQYLSGAKDWYQFSVKLQNDVSQYNVQQNLAGFNVNAMVENLNKLIIQIDTNNTEMLFKDTGIKEFVDRVNGLNNAGMENLKINSIKLKSLKNLLQRSMITPIDSSCTANGLIVKGYNIKMSEVVNIKCDSTLTKIIAINKIFIDANVKKPETQFQIISPNWEIIGDHTFELPGLNGANYDSPPPQAAAGMPGSPGAPGIHGEPGRPGHQGGHFFGIGSTFISGQTLKIISNGGLGGNGQDGGNGNYFNIIFNLQAFLPKS